MVLFVCLGFFWYINFLPSTTTAPTPLPLILYPACLVPLESHFKYSVRVIPAHPPSCSTALRCWLPTWEALLHQEALEATLAAREMLGEPLPSEPQPQEDSRYPSAALGGAGGQITVSSSEGSCTAQAVTLAWPRPRRTVDKEG